MCMVSIAMVGKTGEARQDDDIVPRMRIAKLRTRKLFRQQEYLASGLECVGMENLGAKGSTGR